MGKKYIIELESGTHMFVLGPEGIIHIGEPDVVYETVDGMEIGDAVINAKPYTEPDLEQVKKEAYDKGYMAAYVKSHMETRGSYQQGLNDAWKAVKKIALMDTETSENVTGYFGLFRIMENLTPMQAIEKIRQYEQKKEQQIQVGDEVITPSGKAVVIGLNDTNVRYLYADMTLGFGSIDDVTWTGRHFDEIPAVLVKMKEES